MKTLTAFKSYRDNILSIKARVDMFILREYTGYIIIFFNDF